MTSGPFCAGDDPFRCRCGRWPEDDCSNRATQEDMLCNICRQGCGLAMLGPRHLAHIGITHISYTIDLRQVTP